MKNDPGFALLVTMEFVFAVFFIAFYLWMEWTRPPRPRAKKARVCARCKKPDREVDAGFLECHPCWEITCRESIAAWEANPALQTPENEYIYRSGWKEIDPDYWEEPRGTP